MIKYKFIKRKVLKDLMQRVLGVTKFYNINRNFFHLE
jgi:hypothetical protein